MLQALIRSRINSISKIRSHQIDSLWTEGPSSVMAAASGCPSDRRQPSAAAPDKHQLYLLNLLVSTDTVELKDLLLTL